MLHNRQYTQGMNNIYESNKLLTRCKHKSIGVYDYKQQLKLNI